MEGISAEPFSGSMRFSVLRPLGRGGMGVVYEAVDRQWNLRVAVKALSELGPAALLRLKNEFRAVQSIHHPNLVRLGELLEDHGQWLITMELVDGVDFVRWVRGDSDGDGRGFDEARLRSALRQLVEALMALHAAGIVHRDVKPANVLVTGKGRLVLLDFGLVTRVALDDALTDGRIIGTVDYMAPEQAAGLSVATSADWYSVGAMLYEALTGRVPFDGPDPMVLEQKSRLDPPAPSTLAAVPPDLDRLCMELLARDPARRIDTRELAARLGIPTTLRETAEPPFVGRRDELAELERALADAGKDGSLTLFVHGESGIGKTTLVRQFVRGVLERGDALVLQSHASDRELVPFNGFDGIVDGLVRYLIELPRDEVAALVPEGADDLVGIFPVLSHVPGFGARPTGERGSMAARRSHAFAAFRRLLAALARRRPLVLVIDDFQWADDDTLMLRQALMRGPERPGWLLVAIARTTDETRPLLRRALLTTDDDAGEARHLFLDGLPDADARALVRELGGGDTIDEASREAHGHPLFLAQLAGARGHELGAAGDLHAVIRAVVHALSPDARRLMEVLAASGRPIRQSIAAAAAGLDAESHVRAADELRGFALTRVVGAGLFAALAPYHDQIAEAILGELGPERRRALHRALAEVIERAPAGSEPRALFLHWLAAGDEARAARAATAAAEEADRQLAFEQAAHYYQRAIELGGDRRTLLPLRACALANAGRKRDAVDAYRQAAALERDEARIEHLRAAAEVLLGNGDIDEGVTLLRAVVREIDMPWPESQTAVLASLMMQRWRARLRGFGWRERPEASVPRRTLVAIDTAWSAAMALSMVDRARGAAFQTRGLLLALDAGEPYRVARAMILEAGFASILEGASAGRQARRAELLVDARRLAERCGHPHALALIGAIEGIAQATAGEFRAGAGKIAAAVPALRAHGTRWEVMNAETLHLTYLALLGDIAALDDEVQALEREALASQDLHTLANLRTGYPALARLRHDDAAAARAAVDESMRGWSQQGFHRQHWFAVFARANLDLYERRGEEAWQRVAAAWRPLRRSLLMRSQFVRVGALNLRGRAALATGRRAEAERMAARLAREGVAWATAFASLLRAAIDREPRAFESAAALLDAAELRMHAAIARRRAGVDDPWWREQGIANPDGFVRCFAP